MLFAIFLTLFCSHPALAWFPSNEPPLVVNYTLSVDRPVDIKEALVFVDSSKEISFNELRRLDENQKIKWFYANKLNFGYVPSRVWLKFTLTNPTAVSAWVLEQQFPLIQFLHFYVEKNGLVEHTWAGRARPFEERPIRHKNLLFPLEVLTGKSATVYLSFESAGPIMCLPRVLTKELSIAETGTGLLTYGIYYGILIAMIVYNLFLFFGTRDRVYLFYVLYTVSFCLFHMCLSGVAYQYLWPKFVKWNHIAAFVLIPLSYFFVSIFTKLFLDTAKSSKIADKILNLISFCSLVLAVTPVIHYDYHVSKITGYSMFSASFFLFAVSLICYKNGAKNIKYFIISFAGVFIANSMYAARAIGFLRDNFITNHGIQIASTAEVFLFSLALVARIKLLQETREKDRIVAKVASEISHNIKSPLATLNAALPLLNHADESVRTLIRYATSSITDLANQLLELRRISEVRLNGECVDSSAGNTRPELVVGLVEQTISLKKVEFKSYDLIHFEAPSGDPVVFVSVNGPIFRSILSNLINNAVEAVGENGKIEISLSVGTSGVVLKVKDNGCGIDSSRIVQIMKGEVRSDKPRGNGLGLRQAVESVRVWGGTLHVSSQKGDGTCVSITLPRISTPAFCASALRLKVNPIVVVLDDDTSIHKIWDQRILSEKRLGLPRIEHFKDSRPLINRLPELCAQGAIFLIDQELLHQEITGLELISIYSLEKNSVLVTSRWDEPEIIQRAIEKGITVLPKILAGQIPIEPINDSVLTVKEILPDGGSGVRNEDLDCVLLDDDFLVRKTWEISAKHFSKKVVTLKDYAEFEAISGRLNRHVKIFVDLNLGVDSGIDVSLKISEQGFSAVYLATGEDKSTVSCKGEMPWIKGIQGKAPYWLNNKNDFGG